MNGGTLPGLAQKALRRAGPLTWPKVFMPTVVLLAAVAIYRALGTGVARSLHLPTSDGGLVLLVLVGALVAVAIGIAKQTMEPDPIASMFPRSRRFRVTLRNRRQFRASVREQRLARFRALDLSGVDLMTGTEFEKYVVVLLESRGFAARHVGKAGDQGVDIVAEKDAIRYAVQTKRYGEPVTNKAVQEVVTGKAIYQCIEAMVVTTSKFNPSAREAAQANRVQLVDRDVLVEWILEFQGKVAQSWRSIVEEGAITGS